MLLALGWIYWCESLSPLTVGLTLISLAALIYFWSTRKKRFFAGLLLTNVALVLLYFWSLGEQHHVVVTVTPSRVTASVDGDQLSAPLKLVGANAGFQSSPLAGYRIQATGEAVQAEQVSFFDRVAAAMRLAQPAPAWAGLFINRHDLSAQGVSPLLASDSWSQNRRGEWQGPPGTYVVFSGPARLSDTYTISTDLMRPDGTQMLLFGLNGARQGYDLQLRFDQPDMILAAWSGGVSLNGLASTSLQHMDFWANARRDVRILLTPYLFALVLVFLGLGVYPVLNVALSPLGPGQSGEHARFARLIAGTPFQWIFAGTLTLIALLATGLVSTELLARMPHVQDSVAYLYQAKIFALGRFNIPAPPPALQPFFSEEYMPFYAGKWFSQYPPGHPIMLTLGVVLGAAWLVEPVLASAALGLVFFLGRRVYGPGTGIIAALLGLSSPFWLFLGSSFMAHATGMFFATAFMVCLARAETAVGALPQDSSSFNSGHPGKLGSPVQRAARAFRDQSLLSHLTQPSGGIGWRWMLLGGFCAGMCFITRQLTAVGLLAPFALYALYRFRVHLQYVLAALAGFALPALFLLVYDWQQMGNPLLSTYAAWSSHYKLGFGPDMSPAGLFTAADGLWNTHQNLSMLSVQLFGWPYGVALAFAFLPFILGAARTWDYLLAASFLCLVGLHVFYWCSCLMYGPRFYYEAIPALVLLTARGIVEMARLPLRIWPRFGLPEDVELSAFAPAILVLALLIYNLRFYLPNQIPLYGNYNYSSDAELRTVAQAHLHHAIVLVVTTSPVFWPSYGNVFFANDPLLRGDIIYARDEGAGNKLLYIAFPGRKHYRLVGTTLTLIS